MLLDEALKSMKVMFATPCCHYVTPFASYTAATTSFDGYLETGGPLPASFAPFTSTAQTARLGTDAR